MMKRCFFLTTLLLACGEAPMAPVQGVNPGAFSLGADFVALKRNIDDAEKVKRADTLSNRQADAPSDFYLAIKRSALSKRWFLSSYLKQIFPGSIAGQSLGTMVVTFKEQGGKLYVFNANDGIQYSSVAAPEVIVDAWPIVKNAAFEATAGSSDYVLFDPSNGLNRFLLFPEEAFATTADIEVDLSYVQKFRDIADGVTYEQVFSGFGVKSRERISGTLGLSLRAYKESPEYTPTQVPAGKEMYFRSSPKLVADTGGQATDSAVKWDLSQPIDWVISPEVAEVAAEARFKGVDIRGAFKRGITNWNEAFGFEALTARDATSSESFAQDDVNYLIIERDPSAGYAFANWRSNPNTGEILGASVFFSSSWFDYAEYLFLKDTATTSTTTNPAPGDAKTAQGKPAKLQERGAPQLPKKAKLAWKPAPVMPTCEYAPHTSALAASLAMNTELTREQKVERFLTHVVLHEIGHTLGLRHNFKGSLRPPTSSVMEYVDDRDAVNADKLGSYDVAAINYLYGFSSDLPTDPFCTDDSVQVDPDCMPYDTTSDPLKKLYVPAYQAAFQSDDPSRSYQPGVAMFFYAVFGKDEATRDYAFTELVKPLRVPATARDEFEATYKDLFGAIVFFSFTGSPLTELQKTTVLDQASRILLNEDGLRSWESRRLMVQGLVDDASTEAYAALLAARTAMAEQAAAPDLTELERGLREDLLRRIEKAIESYFP